MRKVCKKCKLFVTGETCPLCKGNQFSTNWQGRVIIFDPNGSIVAKKLNIKSKGEYAIKVR